MITQRETYGNIGVKLTPQRLAILEYLEGNTDHPSADDVFRAVLQKFPTMSFATVYNTLETLRKRGKLTELTVDPAKKRFDPNTAPHHHLVCTQCGKIEDIMKDFRLEVSERQRSGFRITGSRVEFSGLCPSCQERNG